MQKVVSFVIIFIVISCSKKEEVYQTLNGNAFGTKYTIIYESKKDKNFAKQIDHLTYLLNKSLSTYLPNSDISKINKGESTIAVDKYFKEVFEKSLTIYKETKGVFDPTVGVLVNAWGFGPGKSIKNLDQVKLDSLMEFVGFDKVRIENNIVVKENPNIYFDFNAIAKGYGIDLIGRFLEEEGCENYLIEIGGEVRVRGVNSKQKIWRVGIENPNTDESRSWSSAVELNNESMATSGNYRKFKIDSTGKKFVHTINAKTGQATESDLLSATVISNSDCANVDGYATAFMAMGLEQSKLFLNDHKELQAHLIYTNNEGEIKSYSTDNLQITSIN